MKDWQKKQREFEQVKARAKELRLRLTCTICGEKAKLNCPCGTTQYCTVACQKIDWRDRGHRTACKKIRDERAAEAARAAAPTDPPSPPKPVFYGPAPRSHADEVRARIAAEHEAARLRRDANPEREPASARWGSRCPICLEEWDVNANVMNRPCCFRRICISCEDKIPIEAPCPLCQAPYPRTAAAHLALVRRHVENGVPEAMAELGDLYNGSDVSNEYGILRSTKKAVKIYKRAVELGSVEAMFELGRLYEIGEGVKKIDKKKAMQYYHQAADLGWAKAQNNLAILLYFEERHAEASRYYRLAAEQGHAEACANLGVLYENGHGVERDRDEAKRWYARAAANGHEGAIAILEALNA
ncbi:hypothetical protein SO694_00101060 [Aureococcus anophagefferens]|uniref:MYND-type domain-containing protein n=1 Tax=Aureococcus anophagefferens TaxID=44056 RepID=A0ABR1FMY6_AURAN